MKIDIDGIFDALRAAQAAFELVQELGDAVALVLADAGQPELKARLADLRAENDAARERRHAKLMIAGD